MEGPEGQTHVGCVIFKRRFENRKKSTEPVLKTDRKAKTAASMCIVANCLDEVAYKKRCHKHAEKTKPSTKKAARTYIDYDYIGALSFEHRNWLCQFTESYYHNQPVSLTVSKVMKLLDYGADNARRRCVELTLCSSVDPINSKLTHVPREFYVRLFDFFSPIDRRLYARR